MVLARDPSDCMVLARDPSAFIKSKKPKDKRPDSE